MELVQTDFRDGTLPTKCMWKMVVLVLKGDGSYRDYRGIELGEVL